MRIGRPHIHIGHHFFGSGNLGDDLMLAGFLEAVRQYQPEARLTCAIDHNPATQKLRFPQIEWLSYNNKVRSQCIEACDVWLGLGDSPFQSEVGNWFLDHLLQESEWCRQYGKPAYFLGVGVNDARALQLPQTRQIVEQAEHIWTRDADSARALAEVSGWDKVSSGADLAHLYLQRHAFGPSSPGTVAFLLNFEFPEAFSPQSLYDTLDALPGWQARWLVQEVRPIPGSELKLFARLDPERQRQLDVRLPPYETGQLNELLANWGVAEVHVTSRYHGVMLAAWMGSRVLAVTRNRKVEGAAGQLGLTGLTDFTSSQDILAGIRTCRSVPKTTLHALAELANAVCGDFFTVCRAAAHGGSSRVSSRPAQALRKLRSAWRRVSSRPKRTHANT